MSFSVVSLQFDRTTDQLQGFVVSALLICDYTEIVQAANVIRQGLQNLAVKIPRLDKNAATVKNLSHNEGLFEGYGLLLRHLLRFFT